MKKTILKTIFIFIIMFSIPVHSAIVSDNDGSAFVTKGEFEALKKDFANQVVQYNESIDSKIDGAIASYLAGINVQKKVELTNLYEKYNLVGNKDKGVLWCSNNNKTLCNATNQTMAYDYTYVQAYGASSGAGALKYQGKGGSWHFVLDKEANGRAKKRYKYNKSGKIDGRYITRFWLSGSVTGMIQQQGYGMGGDWHSFGIYPQITSRNTKLYSYNPGYNSTGNYWYGSHNFVYSETYDENTNENVAVYPLSETSTEYVTDMSKTTPTFSNFGSNTDTTGRQSFTDSECGCTLANMQQMGDFPKFTSLGNANDRIKAIISGIFVKMKFADFKYQDFYDYDNGNDAIRSGVVITNIESKGDVTIKGKCDKNGYLILYIKNTADPLWGGQRTSVTDTTSWKIDKNKVTANVEWTRKFEEVSKDTKIFMLYLPTNTNDLGKVTFTTLEETID